MSADYMAGPIVGVDVGGTFTDLFLFDTTLGTFRVAKVPSNRGDEAVGFMAGLRKLGGPAGFEAIVHGTTVGTNALLERKGCKLGIITTAQYLGPVGRVPADHGARHARGGAGARAGGWHHPHPGACG